MLCLIIIHYHCWWLLMVDKTCIYNLTVFTSFDLLYNGFISPEFCLEYHPTSCCSLRNDLFVLPLFSETWLSSASYLPADVLISGQRIRWYLLLSHRGRGGQFFFKTQCSLRMRRVYRNLKKLYLMWHL